MIWNMSRKIFGRHVHRKSPYSVLLPILLRRAGTKSLYWDTAPTGHTILLLESTQNYNQQIENSGGAVSDAEKELLPRLKDSNETEVIIVTLAETTPFYEAKRLLDDLKQCRACCQMVGN